VRLELILLKHSDDSKCAKDVLVTKFHFNHGGLAKSNAILSFELNLSKSCRVGRIRNADFFLPIF
jgi:hypothetical protein